MPQGYYTIEQWKAPGLGGAATWTPVLQLPFGATQTAAEAALEELGQPGFYRLVHMQRVIWADRQGDALRLRKSHASSPANLDGMREMYERTGGHYPVEEVREARRRAKRN